MKIKEVYDNEGKTCDRYTVVLDAHWSKDNLACLCLSERPGHPQGVSLFGACVAGDHLGKKINFTNLSKEIQNHIEDRLKE